MLNMLTALAVTVTFVVVPTIATAKDTHNATLHVSGTITRWNDATKQATAKDSAGTEISFNRNEKTTFIGVPQIGDHAFVKYWKDGDGKIWAKHISVGANPSWRAPH